MIFRFSIFLLISLFSLQTFAQTADDINEELNAIDQLSHVEIGIDFANKLLYNGRSMGVKGATIMPSILYKNKSGFYSFLVPNIWTDTSILKHTKIPDVEFGLGYLKNINDVFVFELGYSHDFITYGNTSFRKLFSNNLNIETGIECEGCFFIWCRFFIHHLVKIKRMLLKNV